MAEWFIQQGQNRIGPVSEEVARTMAQGGQISANDLVWSAGMANWEAAGSQAWFAGGGAGGAAAGQTSPVMAPPVMPPQYAQQGGYPGYPGMMPQPVGKTYSILSIVFGVIAVFFCPIVFGVAGIVMGVVALNRGEKRGLAITAIVVSSIGTVLGMIIGAAIFLMMRSHGSGM